MFASNAVSPSSTTTTATSPPRISSRRLKGLSYLRSHTSHHRERGPSKTPDSHPAATSGDPFSGPSFSSTQDSPTDPSAANSPTATSNAWPSNGWLVNSPTSASSPPHSGTDEEPQASPALTGISKLMARHKSSNSHGGKKGQSAAGGQEIRNITRATRTTSTTATEPPPAASPLREATSGLAGLPVDQMPTIKFIPHQDPRATKPSLMFPATSRTLPHEDCVIRVGRFSEKDGNLNPAPGVPSSNPVGFKSKVVSRRHCEFWCSQGQWYVKDVRSSSGTFLNHIRLSQPSMESRPFPVNDGDVVQLGIDFRGGEEMIFRCVKIRIECNRSWQKGLNNFNTATHKRLRALAKPGGKQDSDAASTHSSECAICLMAISPCQSLFVAPCSHVWHFKCIRPILIDPKTYPQFLCPNCRAVSDLEADVDDPAEAEDWEEEMDNDAVELADEAVILEEGDGRADIEMNGLVNGLEIVDTQNTVASEQDGEGALAPSLTALQPNEANGHERGNSSSAPETELTESEVYRSGNPSPSPHLQSSIMRQLTPRLCSPSTPFRPGPLGLKGDNTRRTDTPTTESDDNPDANMGETREVENEVRMGAEGPLTPRNDVGPFIFNGASGIGGAASLNERRHEGSEDPVS